MCRHRTTFVLVSAFIGLLLGLGPLPPIHAEDKGDNGRQEAQRLALGAEESARELALNPTLVAAVSAQNRKDTSLIEVLRIDQQWTGSPGLTPLKQSLQENPAALVLKAKMEASDKYAFSEMFLTDKLGANVAAVPATSDYWQGDEAKFQVPAVSEKTYYGPLEWDESSGAFSVQISVPVRGESGAIIGVLVVGVEMGIDVLMNVSVEED